MSETLLSRPAALFPPLEPRPVPVVYTMGKVASSSVSVAIQNAGLPCHDIHSLDPAKLRGDAEAWLARGEFPPPHVCVSMAHRGRLFTRPGRCLYITLVRDPLARNLSAYFQNLHLADAEFRDETRAAALFAHFLKTYPHNQPLTWFNREFRDQLGIDVFPVRFSPAARWSYIPAAKTVIFRTDCPDAVKSQVLSDLLGTEIEIGRENDGEAKDYRERYEAVKSLAVFPATFTEKVYSTRYAQHFWNAAERDELRARWTLPG